MVISRLRKYIFNILHLHDGMSVAFKSIVCKAHRGDICWGVVSDSLLNETFNFTKPNIIKGET